MNLPRERTTRPRALRHGLLALMALTAPLLLGCGGTSREPPRTALSAADFRDRDAPARPTASVSPALPERSIGPVAARGGIEPLTVQPGLPSFDETIEPETIEDATVVDALVGNINGKPVYASSFLAPFDGQFRAMAEEMSPSAWNRQAAAMIQRQLAEDIEDELLRSEGRASLTTQQRAGLRYVLEEIQRDLQRGYGGVQTAFENALEQEQGQTIGEAMQEREDLELVRYQLQQIYNRVQVSFRDIEIYYQQNYDDFNPPPTAVLRRILVSNRRPEQIEEIASALAAGKAFHDVADLPANSAPDDGYIERPFEGEYTEALLTGIPALDEQARLLQPGEHTDAIRSGPFTGWVYLDRIDRKSVSLYDAQDQIEQILLGQRRYVERQRYLTGLMEDASFTDVGLMTQRLLAIARERYHTPPTNRDSPAPAQGG